MGALMVIFSLQPKQKAKTKGRLSLFTSPPHLGTLLVCEIHSEFPSESRRAKSRRERRQRPPAIDQSGHACAPLACVNNSSSTYTSLRLTRKVN